MNITLIYNNNNIYSLLGKQNTIINKNMEEKIDIKRYPNRRGTKINIGFTFNNKTPWFMHAEQYMPLLLLYNIYYTIYI